MEIDKDAPQVVMPDGSAPYRLKFPIVSSEANTGFYRVGAGQWMFVRDGVRSEPTERELAALSRAAGE